MIQDAKEIKINPEEEIEFLLGDPPSWFVRWGITMVFLFTFLLLLVGWLVKYPDVIKAPIVLTTEQPVIRIVAKHNGSIISLKIKNEDQVDKGQLLAVLENTAQYEDVKLLKEFLNNEETTGIAQLEHLQLGVIQKAFTAYLQAYKSYYTLEAQDLVALKTKGLKEQITQFLALKTNLSLQIKSLDKERELVDKDMDRQKALAEKGVVSPVDLEAMEMKQHQYQRQKERLESEQIQLNIRIQETEAMILDLEKNRTTDLKSLEIILQAERQKLHEAITSWENSFTFKAPISGTVFLPEIWSEGQLIEAGQVLLSITPPEGASKKIARANLPLNRFGKVNKGQVASIRLEHYPYQEYGVIKGKVESFVAVPENNQYLVQLSIPDPLVTTYQKELTFHPEMQGSMHLITTEERLLIRIFNQLRGSLEH